KAQLAISALPLFQQHGMDVPFQVIHRDQRLLQREGQSLGVAHAHQQRSGESRALGDGDGVYGLVRSVGFFQCAAHDRHDSPKLMPWAHSLAWCWFRRMICAERLSTRQLVTSHQPPVTALKLRRFAAMGCTATAVIPMKSAIPAIPKKTCSGAISPSMACCSIHSTMIECSILSADAPISKPASSALSESRRSVSPKINCGCC